MIKSTYLILFVLITLLVNGCSKERVFKNDSQSFAELIIHKYNNEYFPEIKFWNNSKDTLGIYANGRVRQISEKDTSQILNRIMYDIILEVEQNNHLIRSTDVEFKYDITDSNIPKVIILYPDSTYNLKIIYGANLRKDFGINDQGFNIRAILESPIEYINEDSVSSIFLKSNSSVKLIKHKIETPFLQID